MLVWTIGSDRIVESVRLLGGTVVSSIWLAILGVRCEVGLW